jgi:hypothetical protein
MAILSKKPWRIGENHPAEVLSSADAIVRAKQLAPPGGYWKIETVPPKPASANGEPYDERRIIYIWFGPYEERHSADLTLAQANQIGQALSQTVNGNSPNPIVQPAIQAADGTWTIKAKRI